MGFKEYYEIKLNEAGLYEDPRTQEKVKFLQDQIEKVMGLKTTARGAGAAGKNNRWGFAFSPKGFNLGHTTLWMLEDKDIVFGERSGAFMGEHAQTAFDIIERAYEKKFGVRGKGLPGEKF